MLWSMCHWPDQKLDLISININDNLFTSNFYSIVGYSDVIRLDVEEGDDIMNADIKTRI